MCHYWLQNNIEDFKAILTKFLDRLLARGHILTTLTPIFTQAATLLDNHTLSSTITATSKENTLYIHRTYHPRGIKPFEIRQIHDKIIKPSLAYDQMIVALSRPKNLRDVLTRTALHTHLATVQEALRELTLNSNAAQI